MTFAPLRFEAISSSTGEVYFIELSRDGDNLTCTCSCPAGQNGTHCKHRLGVLRGDASTVSAGDTDKMHLISDMLAGTDVAVALDRMHGLEAQKVEIDRQLKAAKKALARTLDN